MPLLIMCIHATALSLLPGRKVEVTYQSNCVWEARNAEIKQELNKSSCHTVNS